jgi:Tol biopolymer transport system component
LLLYVPGTYSNVVANNLISVDRGGTQKFLTQTARFHAEPTISPDGQRVAVCVASEEVGVATDIWVLELNRGTWNRLTFKGMNVSPHWAPDGRQLYFSSSAPSWDVFSVPADGGDQPKQLTRGVDAVASSVSPDGGFLVAGQLSRDEGLNIGIVGLGNDGEFEPLIATPFDEHTGVLSPDGRWLAYVSNESGRNEVYLRPFPAVDNKRMISGEGGEAPRWAADGSELYYRQGNRMMAVPIEGGSPLVIGRPIVVFEGAYVKPEGPGWEGTGWQYDVTSDGQRFLMLDPQQDPTHGQINVVLNWFEELKRLVPTE